ncbi:hypothetical protein [Paracoccus xiamenensis]|nr:hypothetical protein [Paracoccus xiamenensis]
MKASNMPAAPKPEAKAAEAVLEQMFAYYTHEALPLEKPLARAA